MLLVYCAIMDHRNKPKLTLKGRPGKAMHKPKSGKNMAKGKKGVARNTAKATSAPKGKPADSRLIAFHILSAIIHRAQMLDVAFAQDTGFKQLEKRDRAFIRLLVTTAIRRHGQLNKILDTYISEKPPKEVWLVLLIGGVSVLFLDLSPHAAAHTAVELARSLGFERMAGLVNAVMRRLVREKEHVLEKTDLADNIPQTMLQRWKKNWGDTETNQIVQMLMTVPPLDVSTQENPEQIAQMLGGTPLYGQTVRCMFDGDIRTMADYDKGSWWVQDAAAGLPVHLLGDISQKTVWDLCAAPGGKTAQLIAKGANVLAVDSDQERLNRLKDNLARLKMRAQIKHADILGTEFDHWAQTELADTERADIIILDAPCSATGTVRRRPDLLLRDKGSDLNALYDIQLAMLKNASKWVKKQGIILYITCSIEAEEGEQVITAACASGHIQIEPFSAEELGLFKAGQTEEGWARILPSCLMKSDPDDIEKQKGNDGFFIARLRPLTP